MTRAEELVKRIVKEFEARGYEVKPIEVTMAKTGERFIGWYEITNEERKKITISETYRHNGTRENVTAKLKTEDRYFKTLYEVKIPYEASKRVINNRIDKALEKFIYSEPEPFKMEMLDAFYQ